MRIYLPVSWALLGVLEREGAITDPLDGWAVDPTWRGASPDVDEEQWEYEAQQDAAAGLAEVGGGLVLAADLPDEAVSDPVDGRVLISAGVRRQQVGALLDDELAWFGLQELERLLLGR